MRQVTVAVVQMSPLLNQVGDNLSICFRLEPVSSLQQAFLQGSKVLDYAIVDYRKVACAIRVGMSVSVRRSSVRCPSRVSDARCGVERLMRKYVR